MVFIPVHIEQLVSIILSIQTTILTLSGYFKSNNLPPIEDVVLID